MTTTLFVLAKNEVEGMKAVMPLVKKEWCGQILIVDGHSTDGTVEYAREKGYDVYLQREPGLRAAYQESWPLIKGEYVITFSPDGNSPPEYIPRLIEKIKEGYDMVVGSRYFEGPKSEDDDALTSFGNWLFTKTINVLHRGNYSDAMTILMKTADIACPEPARIGGKRKLQIVRWGVAYMTQVIFEKFRAARNPRRRTTPSTGGTFNRLTRRCGGSQERPEIPVFFEKPAPIQHARASVG
jgi:glycosyltransferase involved in cell wall biosynthesis